MVIHNSKEKVGCSMKKSIIISGIFDENSLQMKRLHPIKDPKNTDLGKSYRFLIEFFGKELIAYRRKKVYDKNRTFFIKVFSKFLNELQEGNSPSEWKESELSFWEEFIVLFFPHNMVISTDEKEVENLFFELRKFIRWIDRQNGTNWYLVVNSFITDANPELKICEHLLNKFYLRDYPKIHHHDWNYIQDMEKLNRNFIQCTHTLSSIFEVKDINNDIVVLNDCKDNHTYYLKDLPYKFIVPGIIMNGIIGKKSDETAWSWHQTGGIYPNRAKYYL